MFIGNINTIPSIVNLPGQKGDNGPGGAAFRFIDNPGGWFEATSTTSPIGIIDNIAISCWIKIDASFFVPPTDPTTSKEAHIIDKYSTFRIGGYRLYLRHKGANITPGGGDIDLIFQATETGTASAKTIVIGLPTSGENEIKADTVYLVTAQCGSSQNGALRLRGANGVSLDRERNDFLSPNPSTGFPVFVIGNANPTTSSKGFPGVIDEVALWPDGTVIDSNGADKLFNWPIYKDLMNSGPLGIDPSGNNIQPKNWFRMGEGATKAVDPGTGKERWTLLNKGSADINEVIKSDAEGAIPLPEKVTPGLPNELYA